MNRINNMGARLRLAYFESFRKKVRMYDIRNKSNMVYDATWFNLLNLIKVILSPWVNKKKLFKKRYYLYESVMTKLFHANYHSQSPPEIHP